MKGAADQLVLSFYPNARGFAYVIFEGPRYPVDWGTADIRRKYKAVRSIRRLLFLIDHYRPDTLVIREMREVSRQSHVVDYDRVVVNARRRGIRVVKISRARVKSTFAVIRAWTRYAIAEVIAHRFPMFAPLLPPPRKIWNGEDRRMGLFDAAAQALVYFDDFSGLVPAA
jgi:hypothetical protein